MHKNSFLIPPDAAESYPPVDWRAAWIWTAAPTKGEHDFVYFRKTFRLESADGRFLLRLAAERDASLWVNGELIDHGPPISDPAFKRYQTYDLTGRLGSGANVIAVRVYHDCTLGSYTRHATARGLLCQLEIDGEAVLISGPDWKALHCSAWLPPAAVRMGDSMWPEFFDARRDFPGWQMPDYHDDVWPNAVRVIPETHGLWGAEQPQAKFFPWVNLIPSETRPLLRERHCPASILQTGEVVQLREAYAHDTAIRMSVEPILTVDKIRFTGIDSVLTNACSVTVENYGATGESADVDGLRNATVVLDFGKLMNARLGFTITANAVATIDIGYSSRLENGRVIPYVSNRTQTADCYISRDGEQSWETADWRHFRYVQLTFRNLSGPLRISSLYAESVRNAFAERGSFLCDDEAVTRSFDVVRRTTDLSVVDRTMDNPSRERKQYLGDCSAIIPAITSCFGDAAIVRRYFLQLAEGQHPTGQYRYSYPGHDDDKASLFDHALTYPLRLNEYYQFSADTELISKVWPSVERFAAFVESLVDESGFIGMPPYNIWFDWGHMDRRGHFLPLQALSIAVLDAVADLADALGQSSDSRRTLATKMRTRIPDWFAESDGAFVDAIIDGKQGAHCSIHANSLVAYYGLADQSLIQPALDRYAADPTSFGGESPAWFYVPGAFTRAGRPELALRWLRRRMKGLDALGINTWPETWNLQTEETLGHARCRNSRAVAQGAGLSPASFLLEQFCGIRPGSPGFRTVHLHPQPGDLRFIEGTRPGPDGDYSLKLQRQDNHWDLEIDLPSAREVCLDLSFTPQAQTIVVNGKEQHMDRMVALPGYGNCPHFKWHAEPKTHVRV